jgi:anion transporter
MPDNKETVAPSSRTEDHLEYARLLRHVDLFAGVDRVTLAKLAAHMQPQIFERRSIIFRQGDAGDAFYLVASGSVGVYSIDRSGTETLLGFLHAGEPFGEMALLTNNPRAATIKVEAKCEVLRLERIAFLDLVREQPSVALAVAATLARRLGDMLDQPGENSTALPAALPPADQIKAAEAAAAAAAVRQRRWRPGRTSLSLLAAIAIFGLGWTSPPPHGLSLVAWHGLVLLLAVLPPLVLDALLEGVLGLLLACGWVLFHVTSAPDALSGFASTSWVLVVSVLIIGAAITQTGVLYRLALETITHMRGGFVGEAIALACAGQLLGPAVPNATSRIIIIAPMLRELVDALGYTAKSKAAAGLAMAVLIGFGQMAATTLTSGTTAVLVAAVLPLPARNDINWITWTLYGAPFNIILFIGLLGTILLYYRPSAGERQPSGERTKSLQLQRALLGPMSREEKISLWVGAGLLAGFITQPLHRIDPGWVAAIAVGVLSVTRVISVNTLRAVNWNFALLFGVLISLSTVFGHAGIDRWVANAVSNVMGDLTSKHVEFMIALTLFCFAISFVVRWQAASPLVTIAIAPIADVANIHPFIVGLISVVACNGFFLPYQSTTYLALNAGTGGQLFTHAQALPTAFAFFIWTVIAAALSVPIWHMMGLM